MSLGMRLIRTRSVMAAMSAVAALAVCLVFAANGTAAEDPAIFEVGTAVKNINPDPDDPQYIGGYDYKAGPTSNVHDDLEARAFVVGKGNRAMVFVVVDSTGWFAAYDGIHAPYGVDATRQKIADALNRQGYEISRANVIISTTHVHAAPTVVGIWGNVDNSYLKKLSDRTVAAATKAARKTRRSELWTGVGNLRSFIWQNGQGTNHPDGFEYDNEVPVLWARDPKSGATNGIYASVPNHPDQFNGGDNNAFSADWPGYARKALDELNGTTTVIGPGTLGKQEPPGSVNTYEEVIPQGKIVANEIQRTLARATPITDGTIATSEQPMETLADNQMLLTGIELHLVPEGICLDSEEFCTLPRSNSEPYMKAGPTEDTRIITTHVVTARIGDVVYTTNPGEAFSEVNFAIRDGIEGARHVATMSQSGDMLGYYYERGDYTDQQFGSSNFETYNVGPDLPADNVAAALAGARAIGFSTTPQPVHSPYNTDVADRPGIQWYPTELETANPTVNIYASSAESQDETVPAPGEIRWDFGHGGQVTTVDEQRFDHTFPGPGSYEVTAEVTGDNGKTRSWTETITINPPLEAKATQSRRTRKGARLKVRASGGSGELVAARWRCPNGRKVEGLRVFCKGRKAGVASVVAVDGAGNTVKAKVRVAKAPRKRAARLSIVKAKFQPRRLRRGRIGTLVVKVKNTGKARTKTVRVCFKVPRKARKKVRPRRHCREAGKLNRGQARTVAFGIKATRAARGKVKVRVLARARGAKPARKTASLRITR